MGRVKVDYSNKIILNDYGNEVKILELYEQRKRASYWKYICPYCGQKKYIAMGTIYGYGFSCPCCSDGISYPERVIALVLKALGINFKKQHKFNDYGEYYYDFYLIDYGIIIEVHGEQHYEKFHRHSNWKTYNEEHENDMIKYDIAVLNGFEYSKTFFR